MLRRAVFALGAMVLAPPIAAQDAGSATRAISEPNFDFPIEVDRLRGQAPPLPSHGLPGNPRNVPLDGAGSFQFPIDLGKIGLGTWRPGNILNIRAQLWFDAEGKPVDCKVRSINAGLGPDPDPGEDHRSVRKALCDHFRQVGEFRLANWYGGEVEKGYINAQILIKLNHQLLYPLRFVSRGEGTGFGVSVFHTVTSTNENISLRCDTSGALSRENEEQICDLLEQSPEALKQVGLYEVKLRAKRRFTLYLPTQDQPIAGRANASVLTTRSWRHPTYTMPPAQDLAMVGNEDIELRLAFEYNDNPLWRNPASEWEGSVRIQLEIHPNGRVKKCVPLYTSGIALVDNATCAAAVRRARVKFLGNKPDGPVYYRTRVSWTLP